MASWAPLRRRLESVADRVTLSWDELIDLVSELPPSAYEHRAFWRGDRTRWAGFTTADVRVGERVTFVRRAAIRPSQAPAPGAAPQAAARPPDVLLIGCVRSKLDRSAPARDLYTSTLFRKGRAYAEAAGAPWFILSAKHGLLDPDRVIAPYELRMEDVDRAAWGERVVADLVLRLGGLADKRIEAHAGAAYLDAIRARLVAAGATVIEPLEGLPLGKRLAWYSPLSLDHLAAPAERSESREEVAELVSALRDRSAPLTPARLIDRGRAPLEHPGLYSWWVDEAGARDISDGLGELVAPGLIYAGLAGATRSQSGRRSTNTLWGRLVGMHLGSRSSLSTFRRSLGAALASAGNHAAIDEASLTEWMHRHLRVIAVPVVDADRLDGLETAVLAALDPPLNLAKMPTSAVRVRLSAVRRVQAAPPAG